VTFPVAHTFASLYFVSGVPNFVRSLPQIKIVKTSSGSSGDGRLGIRSQLFHHFQKPLHGAGRLVEVEDAGSGISPEKLLEIQSHGAGVGIRGMRERILQCGGEMKIESEGSGTKISITLPASTS
jgi:hypothetical protein